MKNQTRSRYHWTMRERTQEEWLCLIRKASDPGSLRRKLSAIVWWDWFAPYEKPSKKLKKEFNKFSEEDHYDGIDNDLREALLKVGYRERDAVMRSILPAWQKPNIKTRTYEQRNRINGGIGNIQGG